jgi:hypothetical protein
MSSEAGTEASPQDVSASCASNLDEALNAFEEALRLIDKAAQPAWYGVVLHDIAQTYEVAERYPTAVELYRESAVFKRRACRRLATLDGERFLDEEAAGRLAALREGGDDAGEPDDVS